MDQESLRSSYPGTLSFPEVLATSSGIMFLIMIVVCFLVIFYYSDKSLRLSFFATAAYLMIISPLFLNDIPIKHENAVTKWEEQVYEAAKSNPTQYIPIISYDINSDGSITAILDTTNQEKTVTSEHIEFTESSAYLETKLLTGFSEYGIPDQYIYSTIFLNKESIAKSKE